MAQSDKNVDLNLPFDSRSTFYVENLMGLSLLPFNFCTYYSIAMTLMYAFLEGDIIYRSFFVRYLKWQISSFCSFMIFGFRICQIFI